ncbi:AlbA family DNA-binding domain-containing protein [Nocardioides immobilis]|uniref:AlbA family DNA-binding domain-containing protein n=1 Tax=Nocardioides immobilis TaxID=2049295 RepID=UPI0015F8107A|nr:ATP-binding protein [Nocardioides immobilis]
MNEDAIVVEPVVTAEKLASLLAVGCELPMLDFKQVVDLDEHSELVELAKDVAALRSCGGYLAIGVNDEGEAIGLDEVSAAKFDEANLRQKLEKFLHPTNLIAARHKTDGKHVVLIYVPRHPLGFTVVKVLGEYTKPGGGQKIVLRPGDVFVRHGTSSERWAEGDVEALLRPRDNALRESHRAEFAATVAAIQSGAQGQSIASGPVQSLVWQLDQASFDGAVVELLRRADLVPIRLFLVRTPGEARASANRGDRDELNTILDRLVSLAAIALTLGHAELEHDVTEALANIYEASAIVSYPVSDAEPVRSQFVWLDVLARVVALGGLAVVMKEWGTVRALALQSAPDNSYASWLRHGLTHAARANIFPTTASGKPEQGALIPLARRVAHRLPALRPYAPDDDRYDPTPGADIAPIDPVLDSLCAFDALAALVVMADLPSDRFDDHHYYPSFGHYYSTRSEPYWARVLKDPTMRDVLLPDVDDEMLGRAMSTVARVAHTVVQGGWGLWDVEDNTVMKFIQDWRREDAERRGSE